MDAEKMLKELGEQVRDSLTPVNWEDSKSLPKSYVYAVGRSQVYIPPDSLYANFPGYVRVGKCGEQRQAQRTTASNRLPIYYSKIKKTQRIQEAGNLLLAGRQVIKANWFQPYYLECPPEDVAALESALKKVLFPPPLWGDGGPLAGIGSNAQGRASKTPQTRWDVFHPGRCLEAPACKEPPEKLERELLEYGRKYGIHFPPHNSFVRLVQDSLFDKESYTFV